LNKPSSNSAGILNSINEKGSDLKKINKTYGLLRKLASINGINVSNEILDRVMYSTELFPPLGKEYWWLLFFGREGEMPVQLMILIFRKNGQSMIFNDKKIVLKRLGKNQFQAATAGWIFDGNELHDLGDTNAITTVFPGRKALISEVTSQEIMLAGGYPNYELKVGNIIDLNMRKGEYLKDCAAHGIFIPPFGMAWVDVFSEADGIVLGKEFKGTAHLQKVIGIAPFGPFHWGRLFFKNGSSASFFCLKAGKDSNKYFHRSVNFYDNKQKKIIEFKKPRIKISKKEGKNSVWTIEGQDADKKIRIVLNSYATKKFIMEGGGSQVYIEYAVTTEEFYLEVSGQKIDLIDLGRGVGTFEDAYGSPI